MHIISKYHDYYDTVMKAGIDKTLVYKRELAEFTIKANPYKSWEQTDSQSMMAFAEELRYNLPKVHNREWATMKEEFYATPVVVGFCGKMHLGYKLEAQPWGAYSKMVTHYAWSTNDVICFLKENKLEESLLLFLSEEEKLSKTYRRYGNSFKGKFRKFRKFELDEIFSLYENDTRFTNMFIQYHTPVFAWEFRKNDYDITLKVNPVLTEYEFIKHIDPYTAFQEISMYLGGVLGVGQPEMVTVSDEHKALKHGMDKTSFRTPTPGKKFNRRNK